MNSKSNDEFPLVSVGIPTYNGSNSIIDAINSVLKQDYPNLEIIVSDDCSKDDTDERVQKIADNDSRIQYFRQAMNIGLTKNFEFVMRQASGEFFMWVGHDDFLEPGVLKKYVEFLLSNPDYSLVSGEILYLGAQQSVYHEKNLSLEHDSPIIRVANYYFKVVQGALYYGLMRRSTAQMVSLRNRIGDDWHFVATLAFLGKIKNLNCIAYNKKLGGTSRTFRKYAKIIGASWLAGNFPHVSIAVDAFSEVLFLSPVYEEMSGPSRATLATLSCMGVLLNYYVKIYPFVVGGRLKRFFKSLLFR
jgi:glycosyltransferase involved in cell wall biosynthesis